MIDLKYNSILFLTILLTACAENQTPSTTAELEPSLCLQQELTEVSAIFLSNLIKGDVVASTEFYAANHKKSGPGYGVNYTFFPEIDPEAVFDIKAKNSESEIFVEDLGIFENGRLVGFFQSTAKGQTQNIKYLNENHWDTFAVCNVRCIDGEWKISDYTCFEDSGSPFE